MHQSAISSFAGSNRKLPAKKLSVLALLIWTCSLFLTGLVLYSEQRELLGIKILGIGWASSLVFNFAWFANIFFLLGISRVWNDRPAHTYSVLALLFSLDTFRFTQYLLDEGGATTPVYGYGWGAVLWLLSICLLLVAVGTRQIEVRIASNGAEMADEWLRPIGLSLCVLTLGVAIYFAVHDRIIASDDERARLKAGLAFKREAVCDVNPFSVSAPIRALSGPLELQLANSAIFATYPFGQLRELLDWGIPVIRVGDRDFSYSSAGRKVVLTSMPASGVSSAILYIAEAKVNHARQIRAKLVERPMGRIVFDHSWKQEANGARFCPDYQSFPTPNQQPRALLTRALSLPQVTKVTAENPDSEAYANRAEATVISRRLDEETREMRSRNLKGHALMNSLLNKNCPEGTGWTSKMSRSDTSSVNRIGLPFMVGERAFYPKQRESYNATCSDGYAYLYFSSFSGEKYHLTIEKRAVLDFRQLWNGTIVIPDISLAPQNDVLKIQSVMEDSDGVTLEVINENSGMAAVLKAPIKTQTRRH